MYRTHTAFPLCMHREDKGKAEELNSSIHGGKKSEAEQHTYDIKVSLRRSERT